MAAGGSCGAVNAAPMTEAWGGGDMYGPRGRALHSDRPALISVSSVSASVLPSRSGKYAVPV